jgi:hypothetical protein
MQGRIRTKLATAAEVLAFAQAHPDTDPSHVAVVTRLQAAVARADVLALQQRDGTADEHAARLQRDDARHQLQAQLRHLARVGLQALSDHPVLQGAFVLPEPAAPLKVFITAARSMLAAATAQKDVLVDAGLGTTFVEDVTQAIATFDATTSNASASKLDHIGARADLDAVTRQCLRLVRVLDGLNRQRFAATPDLLAEWASVQHVTRIGRRTQGNDPVPVPAPVPLPVPVAPPAQAEGGGTNG